MKNPLLFVRTIICLVTLIACSASMADTTGSAWDLLWSNQYQEAAASFNRILAKEKNDNEARRGLLMAQFAIGDEKGALGTLKKYADKAPHSQYDPLLMGWISDITSMEGRGFRELMVKFSKQLAKDKQLDPISRRWIVSREVDYLGTLGNRDAILKCAEPLNRIANWTILGPFDNTSGSGHRKQHVENFNYDPEREFKGKFGQPLHWFHPLVYPLDCSVSPTDYFYRTKYTTSYAKTRVWTKEAGTYLLSFGYQGEVELYLDGVLFQKCPRESGADEVLQWRVDLPAGWTQIGVKISNREDNPGFSCALSRTDGSPIKDFTADAAGNGFNVAPALNPRVVPNPIFQRIAKTATTNPEDIEAAFWNIQRARLEDPTAAVEKLCVETKAAFPECGLIALAAFEVLHHKGDSRTALVKDMLKIAPSLALASIGKATLELDKDRFAEATEALSSVYAPKGHCFTASMLKIKSLEGRELWEDSKSEALQATEIFPDEPEPYLALMRYDDKNGAMGKKDGHRKKAMARMIPVKRLYMDFLRHFNKENYGKSKANITEMKDLFPSSELLWYYTVLAMEWDSDSEHALRQNVWSLKSFPQSQSLLTNLAGLAEAGAVLRDDTYREVFDAKLAANIKQILDRGNPGDIELLKKYLKKGATEILNQALDVDPGNFHVRDKINALKDMPPVSKTIPDPKVDDISKLRVDAEDYPGEDSVVLLSSSRRLVFDRRASLLDKVLAVQILSDKGIQQWENTDLGNNPYRKLKVLAKDIIKKDGPQSEGKQFLNKIMFPGLAVGDIVLLHYQTNEYVSGNLAGNFWDQHLFAFETAPCVKSKYEIILPRGLVPKSQLWNPGSYLVDGYPKNEAMTGDLSKTIWLFENLPSATREPLAPSSLQTMPWLDLSTIPSWSKIAGWYADIADGQVTVNADIKAKAKELVAEGATEPEAVANIFDFVANNIRYESVPFFQSGYVPRQASDVLADGYGDCKDKVCLMISLLKSSGFDGYHFALVTPGAPSEIKLLPSPRFNHAIVFKQDENKTAHWYDPTYAKSEPNQIPRYLAGAPSLVAAPQVSDLAVIAPSNFQAFPYRVNTAVVLDSAGNGTIKRQETLSQVDHIAWLRSVLSGATQKEMKERQNTLMAPKYPGVEVADVSVEGLEPGTDKVVMNSEYTVPELGELDDGILSIRLPWSSQLADRYGAVVAQQERELPIDLWSLDLCENDTLGVKFPAGHKLIKIPSDKDLTWRACHYQTHYEKTSAGLKAIRNLTIAGKKVRVEDYTTFKTWMDEVRRDLNRTHHLRTN